MVYRWFVAVFVNLSLLGGLCSCAAQPTAAPAEGSPFGQGSGNPGICAASIATPQQSDLIQSVTLFADPNAETPSQAFAPTGTVYVRVGYQNVPADTTIRVTWLALSSATAVDCDTQLGSQEQSAGGAGTLDFSLAPQSAWSSGDYKVQVSVAGKLDREVTYSIP